MVNKHRLLSAKAANRGLARISLLLRNFAPVPGLPFAPRLRRTTLAPVLLVCAVLAAQAPSQSIFDYIARTWSDLTRSNTNLAAAAVDPKFSQAAGGHWPVYVSETEDLGRVERELRAQMAAAEFERIELRQLPPAGAPIQPQGLLYLPRPYVVPGGRFNEMYGWDSYFILLGLLRDNRVGLARDMVENFLYEIRHYGKILNANRTYYLTRSHPPFLTGMLLAVYARTQDRQWLEQSLPAIEATYRYWTEQPHLTPETGLSRYFDLGDGPAPEVLAAERDAQGRTHYELVKEYFRSHKIADYDVRQYYDRRTDTLLPAFYKGDRSMRESGFDPSNRFGPFSIDIIHYNPVCLNALLYLMESQTAEILTTLGRQGDAEIWKKRARDRAGRINSLMWDSREGLYYDYDFIRKRVRRYPFLTAFYPLWTGMASPAQAAHVVRNLKLFERSGGLQTSAYPSGSQWDAPFGWAPLEWIAVQGLRRYGYEAEASRISERFLSLVLREFERQGTIVEKYDVDRGAADVSGAIRFGYRSNERGFGWTNAVFTMLYDALPPEGRRKVTAEASPSVVNR